jgi:arylsulfatase A-like enzyme
VVFENAHAAAPLCSPARGALFTGIAPHRNGIQGLTHSGWRYREGVLTAPERLRAVGYRSTLIGLQHEDTDPTVLGYDEVFGLGFLPRVDQVVDAVGDWLTTVPPAGARPPLLLTVGTWEVHRPWPHSDYEPADPAEVDVPAFLPDNADTRRDIADFSGSIRQFDAGFGRLVALLDEHLDPENTLVIFTTDHGSAFPRAKSTLYDAGTGVALIVRPPKAWKIPPARVTSIVAHVDVVPSLLDAAGAEIPSELEGRTLLPLLRDPSTGDPDRIVYTAKSYHDTYDPKRAARSLDYAYIRNYEEGPRLQLAVDLEKSPTRQGMGDAHLEPRPAEELYDRRSDPAELVDVSSDPAYADVKSRYANALHQHLVAIHDPIETERLDPAPARTRAVDALEPIEAPEWVDGDSGA